MHPEAADRLGLRNGDVVRVTSPHGTLEAPLYRYPGIKPSAVAIAMGGGHTGMGRFADGNGVNPMTLLAAAVEQPSGALALVSTKVNVEGTGVWKRMASIEGSDDQHDRPIAMAVELATLTGGTAVAEGGAEGEAAAEGQEAEAAHGELQELNLGGGFVPAPTEGHPEDFPLPGSRYGEYADAHEGPRWAMAIDLDRCTGCSACVIACQSENNVPWVGEDQIAMGRDMAWIRLERYYEEIDATQAGPLDVRLLPMLCQHCGNAPCEPVCPVFASYHTPDGINAQVYNRCVGTRYCANNCPYKVRVFNWYRYTRVPEPMNWAYNPDVTVRDNGVMEKCSFCIQRIHDAQNRAALEGGRVIEDGEIVPACQQTCPAEAIVFGNIRDEESRVARLTADARTYRALDALINTQPAVSYLRKTTFHAVTSGEA
jgi:molybdopterin-containing oxidoreductase family iron-sulfur binding subunit